MIKYGEYPKMKKMFSNKKIRNLVCVFLILVITILIELAVFNFHPIMKQDAVQITYEPGLQQDDGLEKVIPDENSIELQLTKPVYIKKLKIDADVIKDIPYQVEIEYVNEFGFIQKERIGDLYNNKIDIGVTNINRTVQTIKIVSLSKVADFNIQKIDLQNQVLINKFRMVWMAVSLFILCLLIFMIPKVWFEKKLEWIFVILACLIGGTMLYTQTFTQNGWDEHVHFAGIYEQSFFKEVPDSRSVRVVKNRIDIHSCNTIEERGLLKKYLDRRNDQDGISLVRDKYTIAYNRVAYLFQSFGMALSRKLGQTFTNQLAVSKLFSLISYIVIMFVAIKSSSYKKICTVVFALFPILLFIAGTFNYDVFVVGFLTLGFIWWIELMKGLGDRRKETILLILDIFVFLIGSLSKAIYIPFVLLILLLPEERFGGKRNKRFIWMGAGVIFFIMMATFIGPTIKNMISGNIGMTGDPRGGNTDVVLQMQSVLRHPIQYGKLLMASLIEIMADYFMGVKGIANFGRMYAIKDSFCYLTAGLMIALAFGTTEESGCILEKKARIGLALIIFIIMCLIFTSMYLAYTEVGYNQIRGDQARYYLPFMLPVLYLCENSIVKINMNKALFHKLLICAVTIMSLYGIYYNMLKAGLM